MKRVFIVHGWDGFPGEGWFPWLKIELEKRGFTVTVPAMPNPSDPRPELWVAHLSSIVGKPDAHTYFVGHSMGCQTILRYAASLPVETRLGGAIFVAPWATLTNIEAGEQEMAKAWLDLSFDPEKARKIVGSIFAFFSPSDKWVPIENEGWFKEKVGATTARADGKGVNGHFSGSDGVVQLPEALDALLKLAAAPHITIDDFAKVEIKMGKILTAERIEGSDKLLKLSIDLGEGSPRTICSGIAQYYQPEEVIGKMVPVITNLAPRKMRGVESNGMVIMAVNEEQGGHVPVLLSPLKEVPPGSPVS